MDNIWWYIPIWVCLKMLAKPLNLMVLLIIIPFLNGYFIGNINPTFQTNPHQSSSIFINLHQSSSFFPMAGPKFWFWKVLTRTIITISISKINPLPSPNLLSAYVPWEGRTFARVEPFESHSPWCRTDICWLRPMLQRDYGYLKGNSERWKWKDINENRHLNNLKYII